MTSLAERSSHLISAWRPTEREERYKFTEIRGQIPRELNGTLYRVSPSQQVLPKAGYEALHTFDGDGLAHAYQFNDGEAYFTGAFVRHPTFLAEEKEGRYCMPGVNLPAEGEPLELPPPGRIQPNTNIVYHAGRLFALVENGLPFELDPRSLESMGTHPFDGKLLNLATSAHPKVDARTGQMFIHGYAPVEPYLTLYTLECDGTVSRAEPIDGPRTALVHDLAITRDWLILPLGPVDFDLPALMNGAALADALVHDPARGLRFVVVSRSLGVQQMTVTAPTGAYFIHFGNAYQSGRQLIFDAFVYEDVDGMLRNLRTLRAGQVDTGLAAYRYRYEIDLETGHCSESKLEDVSAEFPRIDDRRVGYANRYTYAAASPRLHEGVYLNSLVKYDGFGGSRETHEFSAGRLCSEPVFVPRHADADEDDGFLLVNVYHGPDDAMDLVILDARNLASAPLAELRLNHRVPLGFHGNFASALGQ